MSAAFKLAKKKQTDLRRLMQEQKTNRDNGTQKIDSPFAKYDDQGNLNCQICKKAVKSSLWKVHVNTKQHKENIAHAKQLKEKLENHVKAATPTIQERVAQMKEEKKLKGILKNSSSSAPTQIAEEKPTEPAAPPPATSSIPDDFFDSKSPESKQNGTSATSKPTEERTVAEEPIPEGFFDDPMKDAKARHIEYKDPVEEEWEKFRKEIKEAEVESLTIITEEQEESTVERQIDEIDAQIKNWNR